MEWIRVEEQPPPENGERFLACIWGQWVGFAIYARHYDATDRCPGKYEFYYVINDPEEDNWQISKEDPLKPITHWMPLPKPPEGPNGMD